LEHRLQTSAHSFFEWTIFIQIYERREDCYEQLTERRIGRCGGVQVWRRHHIHNIDLYSRVLAARQMLIRLYFARLHRRYRTRYSGANVAYENALPAHPGTNNIFNFPPTNRV
jgi:hypothetical protein